MVRFLHTADWQLGHRASGLGERGGDVREARFEAAGRIMDLACDENADFILVCSLQVLGCDVFGLRTSW